MTTDYRASEVSEYFIILEDGTIIDKETGVEYDVLELIGEIEFYRNEARNLKKKNEKLNQ